jgi:hypothetical protein
MMIPPNIEQIKREHTGQYVAVRSGRPELARFQGLVGQIKTVNMSGRALVQFEGRNDAAWYDIDLECLDVVEKPADPS